MKLGASSTWHSWAVWAARQQCRAQPTIRSSSRRCCSCLSSTANRSSRRLRRRRQGGGQRQHPRRNRPTERAVKEFLPRKAAEEQQRFDKTQMLSFLPPEITAAGTTVLPCRFKL